MASTILSDNGVSSGSAGLKSSADSTGVLALQTSTSGGAATTALTIDTSQNVGIGTTSPAYKLDVVVASNKNIVAFTPTSSSGIADFSTGGVGWGFSRPSGGLVNSVYSYDTAAAAKNNFVIQARSDLVFTSGGDYTNASERMRIDSSGNVGIGTASPDSHVVVSGQAGSANNVLKLIGPSNQLVVADNVEADAGANWWYMYRTGGDGKLRFYRNGLDRVIFDTNGYIYASGFKNTGPIAVLSASLTSSSASTIISAASGYCFFSVSNARYVNSDSSVFTLNTGGNGGITINKSGWVNISFTQDIRVNSSSTYIIAALSINGSNNRNQLISPNSGGSSTWTSILHFYAYYATAGDVLTMNLAGGGGIVALDVGDWSYLNVLWIGGA
jgi:hypothetical protein